MIPPSGAIGPQLSKQPTHWTNPGADLSPLRTASPADSTRGVVKADLDVHFQPIVDLSTRSIFAYEALTRCRWPAFRDPARLFELASQEGACGRLGRLVREVTFERAPGVPLFVNVHPDELAARWLVRPDDPLFVHDEQVFVEITESAAFTHHELCRSVLRELSTRGGVLLAVDDLGAGHLNLKRVLDLEPQVVKLDRALVTGLDLHPRQQLLVRHMVGLFRELGATVVAEGIETEGELAATIDAGVPLGQGFVFGKPAFPLPTAAWPGAASLHPEDRPRGRHGPSR